MSKKHYWKINGYLYEISKEKYEEYKKEQNRHDYLRRNEEEAVILSLDNLRHDGEDNNLFIADKSVNVEDEAIHSIMLDKLGKALKNLTEEELLLIDMLYTQLKSEREISHILGISQKAVNKRKSRLLGLLKKFLEN